MNDIVEVQFQSDLWRGLDAVEPAARNARDATHRQPISWLEMNELQQTLSCEIITRFVQS